MLFSFFRVRPPREQPVIRQFECTEECTALLPPCIDKGRNSAVKPASGEVALYAFAVPFSPLHGEGVPRVMGLNPCPPRVRFVNYNQFIGNTHTHIHMK